MVSRVFSGIPRYSSALVFLLGFIGATDFSIAPVTVEAKVLRHKPTGFRVTAPSGYRLSQKGGIYTVRRRSDRATYMRVSSPMTNRATAQSLVRSGRIKQARIRGSGRRSVITGMAGRNPVYIEVSGSGPTMTVKKYVTRKTSRARMGVRLTPGDVAFLSRILRSARGGIVSPFALNIPRRRFSSGGASATVPNLGWTLRGGGQGLVGGIIQGSRQGQGLFAFGTYNIPPFYNNPNLYSAVLNLWPTYSGIGMTINQLEFIPGTYGPFLHGEGARYTARITIQGVRYDCIIFSALLPDGTGFFHWYSSYVAVRTGAFPGLGDSLMDAWSSWNAAGAHAQRNRETLAILRSTPTVAIDRRAFDRINDAFVEYIRR